jgi:hypothetical protein
MGSAAGAVTMTSGQGFLQVMRSVIDGEKTDLRPWGRRQILIELRAFYLSNWANRC